MKYHLKDAGKNLSHLYEEVVVLRMGKRQVSYKTKESLFRQSLNVWANFSLLDKLLVYHSSEWPLVITIFLCLQRACPGGSSEAGI